MDFETFRLVYLVSYLPVDQQEIISVHVLSLRYKDTQMHLPAGQW